MQKSSSQFVRKEAGSKFAPYRANGGNFRGGSNSNGVRAYTGGGGSSNNNQGTLPAEPTAALSSGTVSFENVAVHDIVFPQEFSHTKSAYAIFKDARGSTFKGNFHRLWKNKTFFLMNFRASKGSDNDTYGASWNVDNSTVRMVHKPLTFSLLTQIYADFKGVEPSISSKFCEKALDELLKDGSIDYKKILKNPQAYADEKRFSHETELMAEGLYYCWQFAAMLMKHPYFFSSGVRRLIEIWLGHTINYHPRSEIAFLANMVRHTPWLCFFDGLLPHGIQALTDKDIDQLQNTLNVQLTDVQKQGIIDYHRLKDYQERTGHITVLVSEFLSWGVTEGTVRWLEIDVGAIKRVRIVDPVNKMHYVEAVQDARRYLAEENVAKHIKRLIETRPAERTVVCKAVCNYVLQKRPLGFSIDQTFAFCKVLETTFGLLIGGPGRGKTFLEIIAEHILSFFFGEKVLTVTVSGKAVSDIYKKKYVPIIPQLENMCYDILRSQTDNGEGPLRFMDLPEDVLENMSPTFREAHRSYVEYAKSRQTTEAQEEEKKMVDAANPHTGSSGLNPAFCLEEETNTVFWTHALKKSNCFYPPIKEASSASDSEEADNNSSSNGESGIDLNDEIKIWARALNSPLNPSGLISEINMHLETMGTDLNKLADYDHLILETSATTGRHLREHPADAKTKMKPIIPEWMITEFARNRYDVLTELAAAGLADDPVTVEPQFATAPAAGSGINAIANKPRARFMAATLADCIFRFRMEKESVMPNPYTGVTCIILDEQMYSLPDLSALLNCFPKLRRLILTGDADQLGAMEKGSLFPQLVQEFKDRGLMPDQPTLRDIVKSRICIPLVENHRVVPGERGPDGAPVPTPLAVAIEDIKNKKLPTNSNDVSLRFLDVVVNQDINIEENNDTRKAKARAEVMKMVSRVITERGNKIRFMTPYKEDVVAINRMAYKNQFGDAALPDGIFNIPLRKGMCVRLTAKAVCFGTFNYNNGDTADEITHIFISTGKNKFEKKDPSGFGGEPRFFRETDVLLDTDWAKAIVVLDNYRLLEMSRFEKGSIIPGYACTIHGGQGSEYPEAWVVLTNSELNMTSFITNAMVYTGVSRASERTGIIATSAETVRIAINTVTVPRMTSRLIELLGISSSNYMGYPEFYAELCTKTKLTKPGKIIYGVRRGPQTSQSAPVATSELPTSNNNNTATDDGGVTPEESMEISESPLPATPRTQDPPATKKFRPLKPSTPIPDGQEPSKSTGVGNGLPRAMFPPRGGGSVLSKLSKPSQVMMQRASAAKVDDNDQGPEE